MKAKFTMLFALILMSATGLYAQGMQRRSIPERVKAAMDKITTPLGLNQDQVTSTDSVFTAYYTAQNSLMQEARSSGQRPDRSKFQKITEERDTRLKGIFTDDQYTKWKSEVEATLRPQRRQGGSGSN